MHKADLSLEPLTPCWCAVSNGLFPLMLQKYFWEGYSSVEHGHLLSKKPSLVAYLSVNISNSNIAHKFNAFVLI